MLLLALALVALNTPDAAQSDACEYDSAHYLQQDAETFDQSQSGWRPLAQRGCYIEAAELIGSYRLTHGNAIPQRNQSEITWHQGQMYALANEYELAIEQFSQAYPEPDTHPDTRYKADAVIAFLSRDPERLIEIRDALRALPEPSNFQAIVARIREQNPEFEPPSWPPSLETVENYVRCFDYPYAIAYEGQC